MPHPFTSEHLVNFSLLSLLACTAGDHVNKPPAKVVYLATVTATVTPQPAAACENGEGIATIDVTSTTEIRLVNLTLTTPLTSATVRHHFTTRWRIDSLVWEADANDSLFVGAKESQWILVGPDKPVRLFLHADVECSAMPLAPIEMLHYDDPALDEYATVTPS